jgi:hypothetical protein
MAMRMIVSNSISTFNASKIELDTDRVFIQEPSPELMKHMEYHRTVVFK